VLSQARADGLDDADIPARYPIVMALVPPKIGPVLELPPEIAVPDWAPGPEDRPSVVREALRLRVRWVQEAGARFAWELGTRLAERGVLQAPEQVRDLDVDALEMTVRELAVTVHAQLCRDPIVTDPLPARFRLSDLGRPIAVLDRHPQQGTGAGGGRKEGRIHIGTDDVPDGAVLVVRNLDSRLAPILPRLNGLVAETGSVLAHLAILARESGVPTVVGLERATERLKEGTLVAIDGTNGAITCLDAATCGEGAQS
jgi:pyruvate,water dikinase